MEPTPTDQIAREAARLFETGAVATVRAAIAAAVETLGLEYARPPSPGRVRQHVQAMSMQALGEAGYRDHVRAVFTIAEELMTLLETSFDDAETLLVGRFARGHVDGDGRMHVRLYTPRRDHEIAAALVDHGYAEPSFDTADTRHGRLSRLVVVEENVEVVITRCPAALRADAKRDLFTGRAIAVMTLEDVRREAIRD